MIKGRGREGSESISYHKFTKKILSLRIIVTNWVEYINRIGIPHSETIEYPITSLSKPQIKRNHVCDFMTLQEEERWFLKLLAISLVSHSVWEGNIFWEITNRGDLKTTTKNLWLERLKSSRVTCIARIVKLVKVIDGYIDHCHIILLLGTPLPLPDVSPSDNDDQLGS